MSKRDADDVSEDDLDREEDRLPAVPWWAGVLAVLSLVISLGALLWTTALRCVAPP